MGTKLTREQLLQIVESARHKSERPNLSGASLIKVNLSGAKFNQTTRLPEDFDVLKAGAITQD